MIEGSEKTPHIVLAEVKAIRAVKRGPQILVEGTTDKSVWSTSCEDPDRIVICQGKLNAIRAVELVKAANAAEVLGIVDDDLDQYFEVDHPAEILAVTEEYNLESMILATQAMERVAHAIVGIDKIRRYEIAHRESFRLGLERRSLVFARLRYVNRLLNLGVAIASQVRINRFVAPNWALDSQGAVNRFAELAGLDVESLSQELARVPPDTWKIINGHDAIEIFRIGLQSLGERRISHLEVWNALTVAYAPASLRQSSLFAQVARWETTCKGKVLCG